MKKFLVLGLSFLLVCGMLSGCDKAQNYQEKAEDTLSGANKDTSTNSLTADFSKTDQEMFTKRDLSGEYETQESVRIELDSSSATASSDSVKIEGGRITITEEATYIISGDLTDGMIIIDADKKAKPQIVLDGVNIKSKSSAALYVAQADKVFVTLCQGKTNVLENGGEFVAIDDNNIDSAVFSKQDLTFNGSGELEVISPAGHGIVCKDDLVLTGGSYTVKTAEHGLQANDSIRITNQASIKVDVGKDGFHCENADDEALGFIYVSNGEIGIEAEGDGISASAFVQIENGSFDLLTGGGSENGAKKESDHFGGFMGGGPAKKHSFEAQDSQTDQDSTDSTSMKGIKAVGCLLINGGKFKIDSADDSFHSNLSLTVNGGEYSVASGDDAFHADESLMITNGSIDVSKSYEGLEALELEITGGEITLVASDDGLNAAGGTDSSGSQGGRDGMFAGPAGKGGPGGMSASSGGSITISGGRLNITASGDGIDANGSIVISGGYTVVCGPVQGDTATLDYDTTATITGGTFIGTGAVGMAQTFSDTKQGVVALNVGNQNAETDIILKDQSGKTLISHSPKLSFAVVILSSPDIISGEKYTVTVGDDSAEIEAS